MERATIDYGIDLGTTNSVVALFENGDVTIIPDQEGRNMTPSAVHIDAHGRVIVGSAAKDRAFDDPDNTATVFKREMGRKATRRFKDTGRQLSPEELSAEVLKSLRADVRDQRGEELRVAVITVPADFELPQRAATKRAAELAGFAYCELLQEPIAAAMAYGYKPEDDDSYWLVYDFGGGTFDAAVIYREDGFPAVVAHAGDNHLGGSDIDRDIVIKKLLPALTDRANGYRLPEFEPASAFWCVPSARMRAIAEQAKIRVCRTRRPEQVNVDNLCIDENGRPVDLACTLTPEDVRDLTAPYLARTLELCQRALADKSLKPQQIDRVLMVGGSTLNPFVRTEVAAQLGRPLGIKHNPMTVVAHGAAINARTRNYDPSRGDQGDLREVYQVSIKSNLTGEERQPVVRGIVGAPIGAASAGMTIEFIDEERGWRNGKTLLDSEGRFQTRLRAEPGVTHHFTVELCRADGTPVGCTPACIEYTSVDINVPDTPLSHSFGVGMADGRLDVLLAKGKPLPAKDTSLHVTARPLQARASSSQIVIPVFEGDNVARALRNRRIGAIVIGGESVPYDLTAGTEIEVTLAADQSGLLMVTAFIPTIEKMFEEVIQVDDSTPAADDLRRAFDAELERWRELADQVASVTEPRVRQAVELLEKQDWERRIRDRLRGEPGTTDRDDADKWIRDFGIALDALQDALAWPSLVARAHQALQWARDLVRDHGTAEDRDLLTRVEPEVQRALEEGSPELVQRRLTDLYQLGSRVLARLDEYWLYRFQELKKLLPQMRDPQLADRLVQQGDRAIAAGDREALKAAVAQLGGLVDTPIPPPGLDEGGTIKKGQPTAALGRA